jgi:thiamine biosynthesis protein ThiI
MEDIIEAVLEFSNDKLNDNMTFAIRARRTGKHDFTSMDLAKKLGSSILDKYKDRKLKVDLSKPDIAVHVEVRSKKFYIFTGKEEAVGGLPLGTQGRILGVYENKNSFIAWWLMMKRGATVIPYHHLTNEEFKSEQNASEREEFERLFEKMQIWSPALKTRFYGSPENIDMHEKSEHVSKLKSYSKMIEEHENRDRVEGLVTGLTLNEFQEDLELLDDNDETLYRFPIFLPLIGLEPSEISRLEALIFK